MSSSDPTNDQYPPWRDHLILVFSHEHYTPSQSPKLALHFNRTRNLAMNQITRISFVWVTVLKTWIRGEKDLAILLNVKLPSPQRAYLQFDNTAAFPYKSFQY